MGMDTSGSSAALDVLDLGKRIGKTLQLEGWRSKIQ